MSRKRWLMPCLLGSFIVLIPLRVFASVACSSSLTVRMTLHAIIPSLPDAPSFAAKGEGEICFRVGEAQAKIVGASIPKLVFEALDPPAGLEGLTVFVEALPDSMPTVSWKDSPRIALEHVDLRVRGFAMDASELFSTDDPLVDITLPGLSFTTDAVSVEGETSHGFIDAENLEVQLVGSATLPNADDARYQQWLVGREVLLELVVQMENPFQRRMK